MEVLVCIWGWACVGLSTFFGWVLQMWIISIRFTLQLVSLGFFHKQLIKI